MLSRIGSHLGQGLLWLAHWLPNSMIAAIGRAIGRFLYRFGRGRVTDINLALCFPDMPVHERERLAREHFERLGQSFMDLCILWFGTPERVLAMTRIIGMEHYHAVRANNPKQPIILLAPHFIGLNLGGARIAHELVDTASIYSRQKNPVVDRLLYKGRMRFGRPRLLSRQDGLRPVIRAIRDGLPFYFLPDMDFGRRDSLFVPFFGVATATVHVLPRLVQLTGAKVIPAISRQVDGGYEVQLYPAWEDYPSGDLAADVRRMNAFIEERALEMLPQYFWVHKRFKTRPEGQPNPYRKR
jgi:Kdo2-lipid IVA lauroyltransferase/acyltransferase